MTNLQPSTLDEAAIRADERRKICAQEGHGPRVNVTSYQIAWAVNELWCQCCGHIGYKTATTLTPQQLITLFAGAGLEGNILIAPSTALTLSKD